MRGVDQGTAFILMTNTGEKKIERGRGLAGMWGARIDAMTGNDPMCPEIGDCGFPETRLESIMLLVGRPVKGGSKSEECPAGY